MKPDLIRYRGPVFLAMLLLAWQSGICEIIPGDRRITWANNVGIPGGIPNRTTIFANLTGIDATGVINVQPAIQAAINACPPGQVVYLPAGTYRVDSHLLISKSITLRGAGMNKTIIKGTVNGSSNDGIVAFNSTALNGQSASANITSGATKGSTNLVIAAPDSNLRPGYIISVDQLDNETFIDGSGVAGPRADNDDRGPSGGGTHHNSQAVEVRTVSGANLTIWPPLVWTFTNSPQIYYKRSNSTTNNYLTYAGVEDLCLRYVTPTENPYQNIIYFARCAYCWAKNVMTTDAYTTHVMSMYGYRMEFRGCTFSNSVYYMPSGGYGLDVTYQTCSTLIEDNIFIRTRDFIRLSAGASGNAVLYNYHTNAIARSDVPNYTVATGGAHSAHPMMNLFEGNITYTPRFDFTWGSSSHQTLLRNWYRGPMPYSSQMGSPLKIDEKASYYNVVGNVLGSTFQKTNPNFPTRYSLRVAPQSMSYSGAYTTWLIGYWSDVTVESGYDANTQWANTIAAGNYDYIAGSNVWYNPTTPETIPNSYFYTNKPAYFGNLVWPPIDSATPTVGETVIPAGYRYRYGTNPPAGGMMPPTGVRVVGR